MLQQVKTAGGVHIEYEQHELIYKNAIEPLIERLDSHRGAIFASSFEYPGRYTCWDIGFYNPPLVLICKNKKIDIEALNARGEVLLAMFYPLFKASENLILRELSAKKCQIEIKSSTKVFAEEERSRQPSVFSLLREIIGFLKSDEPYLGFYGAFGYDLVFQFESLTQCKDRSTNQREMVLYLPDEIYVVNHRKEIAFIRRYNFQFQGQSTQTLPRDGQYKPYEPTYKPTKNCDHEPGEYAALVEVAKEYFARGDLFEVVPSQTFFNHCPEQPSLIYKRMQQTNPSPYGFFINLGENEYLVGASPEMYVRVQGDRVETCPISGTIKRGADAIEDAINIQTLLASEKEASELTMCTDVDRNDKSRICEAGSVRVLGRRQIEMYSRLIHTVDHVEGQLRKGFDAIDAFLTHMWVVTVTGAPKLWAMNFIEKYEKSPRKWYAGAVGWFGFNGDLNTGLVLRTMRIEEGVAEIRVGATLLYDSEPQAEELETRLKASAFLELLQKDKRQLESAAFVKQGLGKKVLLVDHQDSFVHTLANYIRQTGAEVLTIRSEYAQEYIRNNSFDLILLSPGPGRPADFNLEQTIKEAIAHNIPLFGVCLGLQGIVEYFGGSLDVLSYPVHGKASEIKVVEEKSKLFAGLGSAFTVGRYHSLYANLNQLPKELTVTALTNDGIIMAIAHQSLPIYAVQFHPETILSMSNQVGLKIISNLMSMITINAR